MPRRARIPKVDRADPRLQRLLQLMEEVADERCGPSATFEARTVVVQEVVEDVLRIAAQRRAEKEDAD
jgi:hypothetical protein